MDEKLDKHETNEKGYDYNTGIYVPYGVVTFSGWAESLKAEETTKNLRILTGGLSALADNILYNSESGINKKSALKTLFDEYLSLVDTIIVDKPTVANTVAESVTFERKKITEPLEKALVAVSNFFKYPDNDKEKSVNAELPVSSGGMTIWKEASGRYRFLGVYSNNYRDDDNPSEIISKASHKRFVEMVDKGEADYPELWHWHVKGSRWGQCDLVTFDEDTGFAVASGLIDIGHEKEAEALSTMPNIAMSHGMPVVSIKRDTNDKSIIVEHITTEISDLPFVAAANKLTSFEILKEVDMAIPDSKKEYLRQAGLSDGEITALDKSLASKALLAEETQLESKEADAPNTEQETPTPEAKEPVPEDEKSITPVDNATYATKEEVAEVMASLLKSMEMISKLVSDLSSKLEQSAEAQKEKEQEAAVTPNLSLAAMISKNLSIIGNKDASVHGNADLGKLGPTETKEDEKSLHVTGTPGIDNILSNIVNGRIL